jgi:hypothetical protein
MNNFANWPKDQIGLQPAQKHVPTSPLRHSLAVRWNAPTCDMCPGLGSHASRAPPPPCRVPCLFLMLVWMPSFSTPPSLALAAPYCLPTLYLAAERERCCGRAELQPPLSLPTLQATVVITKCTTAFASSFPTSRTCLHGPSITGALHQFFLFG